MPFARRSLLPLLVVSAFATICAFFYLGLGRNARQLPSALIDKPAPVFELPPLREGQTGVRTDDLHGQVTLVNIFASWCAPCRLEHPLLMRLAKEEKVPIIGIAWKDTRAKAISFLDELGDPYGKIGFDGTGRTGIDWGVYGVPETYVVDRDGRVRHKVVGPITAQELTTRLLPLIRELRR
jgi:cytochrome c biogenesis protein CcmG/thiol:disulfide interchange protein DsbE